jgi:hypothetical protein
MLHLVKAHQETQDIFSNQAGRTEKRNFHTVNLVISHWSMVISTFNHSHAAITTLVLYAADKKTGTTTD